MSHGFEEWSLGHRYGVPVRVATDAAGKPARFVWRGVARKCEVVGEWRLVTRWWVTAGEVEALRAAGRDARGPADRAYYRVVTADWQVYELYRDDAAGGAWVLDVLQDCGAVAYAPQALHPQLGQKRQPSARCTHLPAHSGQDSRSGGRNAMGRGIGMWPRSGGIALGMGRACAVSTGPVLSRAAGRCGEGFATEVGGQGRTGESPHGQERRALWGRRGRGARARLRAG